MPRPKAPKTTIQASNDNAPGATSTGDLPLSYAYPSISPAELEAMEGVISALARMSANDLSATTLCSGEP